MNFFKKAYCRTFQTVFKLALPLLPYKDPQILKTEDEVVKILQEKQILRVLLVTDKGIFNLGLCNSLVQTLSQNNITVTVFSDTVANPTTNNVEEALNIYKQQDCQGLIAFGGGSAMDCAKAVGARLARPNKTLAQMKGILKVRKKLPLLIAVPTTAGTGSETTLAAVITDSETRHKYAINDFPLIPSYALLDAKLTLGLPPSVTANTGMDALTHAVEAFVGRSTTKQTRECALVATKLIFENLLIAYQHGDNLQARENMLLASFNAGKAFSKSYVGYVHAIAHSLGGKYNIAHGYANAVILPYVLKKYGKTVYKKLWKMGVYAGLFDQSVPCEVGAKIFIEKIEELNAQMSIGKTIDVIKQEDIPQLAQTAEKEANPLYPVPKLFTAKQLEELYVEVKNGI